MFPHLLCSHVCLRNTSDLPNLEFLPQCTPEKQFNAPWSLGRESLEDNDQASRVLFLQPVSVTLKKLRRLKNCFDLGFIHLLKEQEDSSFLVSLKPWEPTAAALKEAKFMIGPFSLLCFY